MLGWHMTGTWVPSRGLVSWTCPFLGSMQTQLHFSSPWSRLPGLSIVPGPVLEGCFTEGNEGCSDLTLPSRVCHYEIWISSLLGVTPQVQSTQGSMASCITLLPHIQLPCTWYMVGFFKTSACVQGKAGDSPTESHLDQCFLSSKPKVHRAHWPS